MTAALFATALGALLGRGVAGTHHRRAADARAACAGRDRVRHGRAARGARRSVRVGPAGGGGGRRRRRVRARAERRHGRPVRRRRAVALRPASAVWNIAYDAGTGLGATGLGAIAEPFGFAAAFGTTAAVLFVLTPAVHRRRA
ncbi:hypothetical protein [Pseudonocardia sp. ICBG601]|uniref:hypothetical protein n=1 Tax=Pseudonocardia sp. ICBG601 TaxID=2846759 RepID=UPI001CF71AE2|nr:hypothetical protein [Pseudonocardia sp. ICBG601]